MKKKILLAPQIGLVVLFSVAVSFFNPCNAASTLVGEGKMKGTPTRIQQEYSKTKTICFGRFIRVVPASATVVYGPASIDGEIRRYPNEATKIDERIQKLLGEISSEYLSGDLARNKKLVGSVVRGHAP